MSSHLAFDSAVITPLLCVMVLVYVPQAVHLAWHDGAHHRLPNRYVAYLSVTTAVACTVAVALSPITWAHLRTAAVLAVVLGAGAIVISLVAPALLGMGDAKTIPVVVFASSLLGGPVLVLGAIGAMVAAALGGITVLISTRDSRCRVPVGPALLATPLLGLALSALVVVGPAQ